MPYAYRNNKQNFTNMDHFKEMAVKTINEMYGRVNPLDVFDFSEDENDFIAVAYREGEEHIPPEQKVGELTSDDSLSAQKVAEQNAEDNLDKAQAEEKEAIDRITGAVMAGKAVSEEDAVRAVNLGIDKQLQEHMDARNQAIMDFFQVQLEIADTDKDDFIILKGVSPDGFEIRGSYPELEERMRTEEKREAVVVKASPAAQKLAEENGVDLARIVGTGEHGNITVPDVKAYIANPAPAQENADEGNNNQSNA